MTDTPQENQIAKAMPATLTLDVALYEHYLENWRLSDKEKQELLQTLWNLICEFVYLGFGVSPLRQAIPEGCVQSEACLDTKSSTELDLDQVESSCKTFGEQGGDHA